MRSLLLWHRMAILRAVLVVVIMWLGFRCFLVVRMLTVHDVAGHEVMHDFADDLDAKHASKEACNQNPGGLLRGESAVYQ